MPLQVGNLPYKFTAAELANLFNADGFLVNRACMNRGGTGIVELINSRQDKQALDSLNNQEFGGRIIKLYSLDATTADGVLNRDYDSDFSYNRLDLVDGEEGVECIDDEAQEVPDTSRSEDERDIDENDVIEYAPR